MGRKQREKKLRKLRNQQSQASMNTPGFAEFAKRETQKAGQPLLMSESLGLKKLSEALLELCQPYLEPESPEEMKKELILGAMAWNLSLKNRFSRAVIKTLSPEFRSGPIADHIDELIEEKKRLFPHDKRVIMGIDFAIDGLNFGVNVVAEIDPDDLKKLEKK